MSIARRASFAMAAGIAKTVGAASRLTGRGGGTTLPGRMLLRFDPGALERLGARIDGPVTLVSATNGKTTTASLLDDILSSAGRAPVHNRAGSNMTWGVATALLAQKGDEAILEVDEAWLPQVARDLHPSVILLSNLFRDQLDRYGELETIAESWRTMLSNLAAAGDRPKVALNADDPAIADLGRNRDEAQTPEVVYFGVEDTSLARHGSSLIHDSKQCRSCGAPYTYSVTLLGHLGHYRCETCGQARPVPDIFIRKISLLGMEGSRLEISGPEGDCAFNLPLPGLYNAYNALGALAAGYALGIPLETAASALAGAKPAFGRVETVEMDSGRAAILLIKNPAGATEVVRTVASAAGESGQAHVWIALNDRIADGRDVSWIWDAEFERLEGNVRRITCSGTRAEEIALRLRYAGIPREAIHVDRSIERSLDESLAAAAGETVFAMPTYTALLELQALLARRHGGRRFLQ